MPIDPTALANLLLLRKPSVCAYWKVTWDPLDSGEDRYYSDSAYNELPPFTSVGHTIEAQIVMPSTQDTLASIVQFEINPDLRAEKINIEFNDLPARGDTVRPISSRFQTFKSGVRAELFFYFPDEDLTISMWLGQLQAPDSYARKTIQTVVTNGFRSREQPIPRRPRPRECTANWGGWMPSTFASESNGCPAGSFGTIASADLDCPRDSTATCDAKLGTTGGPFFLGFNTDAAPVLTDPRTGYIAISQGNQSALGQPIRVIAGQKYLRGLQMLMMARARDNNQPTRSWVRGLWEVGEGPVQAIQNIRINEKLIEQMHISPRTGELGQPKSSYSSNVSNFSGTAHFYVNYGWIDLTTPSDVTPADFAAECNVVGYNKVAVFTDDSPLTYTRTWTDNRVWWLMELYTNQRFGMAYPETRFEIADWMVAAAWANNTVSFTATFMDGETKVYSGHRTRFECAMEARPVAEQIEDICRSGAISLPFLHESKFTTTAFRPFTAPELAAARVFTDDGPTRNIVWGEGQPAITLTQVPDDKVITQIELTFEEAVNYDVERPLTVDDPNQKLKAGRTLGENNLHPVPKKYAAFGCRSEQEVARLAYRLLRFGEFDEGGTQNNLRATFTVPLVQALGIKRYDIIKLVSTLLDGFEIGTDDGINDFVETPQYFRVLRLRKTGGLVEISAQAYNQTAYEAFETVTSIGPPVSSVCTIDANCAAGFRCLGGVCVPIIEPPICILTFGAVTYDDTEGILSVSIPDC